MIKRLNTAYSTSPGGTRQFPEYLFDFLAKPDSSENPANSLEQIRCRLPQLNMDAAGNKQALVRIENALRYLKSSEAGAARYEIQKLTAVLTESILQDSPEPESGTSPGRLFSSRLAMLGSKLGLSMNSV